VASVFKWSVLLVPLAIAWTCAGIVVAAPSRPRVVVTEARAVDLGPVGPGAVRAAVEDALKAQDAEVVAGSLLTPAQASCATPQCFAGLTRTTGATQVVLVDITTASDEDYDVQLRLWEAASGRVVDEDRVRCKLCAAQEVVNTVREQAGLLWARYSHAAGTAPLPGPRADLPPSIGVTSPHPPGQSEPASARWVEWTPVAVGGAAVVVGAILVIAGDRSQCSNVPEGTCGQKINYAKPGWWLGGVGGAVALIGGGVLTYQWIAGRHRTTVGVGLSGLSIGGVF
jgi:hypothetical protein